MAEAGGTRRQVSAHSASTDARHLNILSSTPTHDRTVERLQDDEGILQRSRTRRMRRHDELMSKMRDMLQHSGEASYTASKDEVRLDNGAIKNEAEPLACYASRSR
eukprot:scaffold8397_cov28-Tisochrysis_lutea.AAC.2